MTGKPVAAKQWPWLLLLTIDVALWAVIGGGGYAILRWVV